MWHLGAHGDVTNGRSTEYYYRQVTGVCDNFRQEAQLLVRWA